MAQKVASKLNGSLSMDSLMDDAAWLAPERDGEWVTVRGFPSQLVVEVSQASCAPGTEGGVFFILRIFDMSARTQVYMGCFSPPAPEEQILLLVDRLESVNGEVLKRDDFEVGRMLSVETWSGFRAVINAVRTWSVVNNYTTTPPWLFRMLVKRASLES